MNQKPRHACRRSGLCFDTIGKRRNPHLAGRGLGMKKTPYQYRMNGFVVVGGLYLPVAIAAIELFSWPNFLYFFALSVACLMYVLAKGFDAVYDSLNERLPSAADEWR